VSRDPRSEPDRATWSFPPDQTHIRSPFATAAPTSRLRRVGRKDETILQDGFFGHMIVRFIRPERPELIRFWKI
jgi:hypothetical protein